MVVHFTEKLRKKLHLPGLSGVDVVAGKHLRWYGNVFTAQRAEYILTTNASSLLSVVMHGGGISDASTYVRRFLIELEAYLEDLGLSDILDRVIAPSTREIVLAKTTDRSVLGSMNDMVHICKHRLTHEVPNLGRLAKELNETPFKANGYRYPREVFSDMPEN